MIHRIRTIQAFRNDARAFIRKDADSYPNNRTSLSQMHAIRNPKYIYQGFIYPTLFLKQSRTLREELPTASTILATTDIHTFTTIKPFEQISTRSPCVSGGNVRYGLVLTEGSGRRE